MTGMPAGLKWEINFGGTWYDVTAYVDPSSAASIHFGRTSPSQAAQPATLQGVQLKNADGRFTPKRQVLLDGVTTNPYYPYVAPGASIRGSFTISAVTFYFYYGLIQSFPPMVENGVRAYVPIQAVDRMSLLSGYTVQAAPIEVALSDGALAIIPFSDPSGSARWAELVGGFNAIPAQSRDPGSGSGPMTSGASDPLPFADGLSGLSVAGANTPAFVGSDTGWQSTIPMPSAANTAWSFEAWVTFNGDQNTGWFPGFNLTLDAGSSFLQLFENPGSAGAFAIAPGYVDSTNNLTFASASFVDQRPHHFVFTGVDNGSNLTIKYYLDGQLFDTQVGVTGVCQFGVGNLGVFGGANARSTTAQPTVTFGPFAAYATTLTATQVSLHYTAGTGGTSYTTGQRIAEYLRWVGISAAGEAIATGAQAVGGHSVAGKTALVLCQDMALTEGGGAVFYQSPAGLLTFFDRHARSSTTVAMTLDAVKDLDGTQYQPSFDNLTQITQSTLSRPGGTDQTYTDPGAALILTDANQTQLFTNSDNALLNVAQDRVVSNAIPAFRVGQLAIDLVTAGTTGLYQAFGALTLAARLRLSGLLAGKTAPLPSVDSFAEGWTLTIYQGSDRANFKVVFDTSPADNPPRAKVGTAKAAPTYGAMTLNTTITSSATTILIANSDGIPMTSVSGAYPITIQFGEEVIELPGPPTGGNPQTFTGCTRGANGTQVAAHTAGAIMTLAPRYAVQL